MSVSNVQLGAQPAISFITIVIFAIIIAEFLIENERNQGLTILFGVIIGLIVAGIELRNLIKNRSKINQPAPTKEVREKKLAQFVAELFDEDIDFETDAPENTDELPKSDLD